MSNGESMAEAMAALEEMFQSIVATSKHQQRLKSGTFWEKLKVEKRTPQRVKQVNDWFQERHVVVNLRRPHSMLELVNHTFGTEDKNDWIILSLVQPSPVTAVPEPNKCPQGAIRPFPEEWFTTIERRIFASEADVECLFAFKLFEHLGYQLSDFAFQHTVPIRAGRKERSKKADMVLFDGENHVPNHALIDVETKNPANDITDYDIGQAASYANWLKTPYYVLTNGKIVKVFLVMAGCPDVLRMSFQRPELRQKWDELLNLVGRKPVVAFKESRSKSV